MLKMFIAPWLMASACTVAAATEVNTADTAQFDSVAGIGPALSAKILAARQAGPYVDWADFIARVPGVGGKSAARLSAAGVTVNGRPYEAERTQPASAARTASAPASTPAR